MSTPAWMLTPSEKAHRAASRIVAEAQERKVVITRPFIAEVVDLLKAEGKDSATAHPRTLISSVRHYARAFDIPVALTDRETEYLWRAVFRHLNKDQGFALKEKLFAEQPELEDSKGFVQAFSVTYFPRSCNAYWTHLPAVYMRWGKAYAWTFVTGLESIETPEESA